MTLSVAVLVSAGRHPLTGRPRRALADACALELALGIAGAERSVIHAGAADEPSLADYLGMGCGALEVIDVPSGGDVVPALADHLRQRAPDLILAGDQARDGEGSALVPYLLAQALGRPLLPHAGGLNVTGEHVVIRQALPKGQRRDLRAPLPAVVTVSPSAPAPRQVAYAKSVRGEIRRHATEGVPVYAPAWSAAPARPRPKRIKTVDPAASAEDRLRAITETAGGGGEILTDLEAPAAADAILQRLDTLGLGFHPTRE